MNPLEGKIILVDGANNLYEVIHSTCVVIPHNKRGNICSRFDAYMRACRVWRQLRMVKYRGKWKTTRQRTYIHTYT